MARGERNAGWSGFFLTFTVFAAILLLLAREGQGEAVSAGARQVLVIYEGLTCWAVPALFMAWGMAALEEGKPSLTRGAGGAGPAGLLPAALLGCGVRPGGPPAGRRGGELVRASWCPAVRRPGGCLFPPAGPLPAARPVSGTPGAAPVHRRGQPGEVLYFLLLCFLFASLLPPGRPSTRRGWWVPCWRGSRSIWCWGMRAIMWRGGICATIPSAGAGVSALPAGNPGAGPDSGWRRAAGRRAGAVVQRHRPRGGPDGGGAVRSVPLCAGDQ